MRTRIYQINSKRDVNRVKFEGLDLLERYQGSSAVDPSIYDEVFNAEIDETDLEAIYQRFNTVGHPLHRGHSLSVSDVVVNDNGAFFCDSIGFQPIAARPKGTVFKVRTTEYLPSNEPHSVFRMRLGLSQEGSERSNQMGMCQTQRRHPCMPFGIL